MTTTFVARLTAATPATADNSRATNSMGYTHAVVASAGTNKGAALSWHTSLPLAKQAADKWASTGYAPRVVPAEAYEGGKASVLRRLAADVAPARAKKAPAKAAPAAPVATPARGSRTWDATAADTHRCAGACGQVLPATSFPTTAKAGVRGVVCRKDRDAARKAA